MGGSDQLLRASQVLVEECRDHFGDDIPDAILRGTEDTPEYMERVYDFLNRRNRGGALPVRRRHPQRHLRPGAAAGTGPAEAADAVRLPFDRLGRRLHRILAVRLDPPPRAQRRARRDPHGTGRPWPSLRRRQGASGAPPSPRLQQFPDSEGRAAVHRYLDHNRRLSAQSAAALAHAAAALPAADVSGLCRLAIVADGRVHGMRLAGICRRRDRAVLGIGLPLLQSAERPCLALDWTSRPENEQDKIDAIQGRDSGGSSSSACCRR